MSVHKKDLEELKRLATNNYSDEKRFINRVIMGIGMMERTITKLKTENQSFKEALKEKENGK